MLRYVSMMNPVPMYILWCGVFGVVNVDALRKYEMRGFTTDRLAILCQQDGWPIYRTARAIPGLGRFALVSQLGKIGL